MFTGIVQQLGAVEALEENDFGAALRVDPRGWGHRPGVGDSIAISGCCLTVARRTGEALGFDVIRQTLATTTLGSLGPGDRVNLEHAVTPSTLLGGHIVQGHVEGVGAVSAVHRSDAEWRVRVEPPAALMECIVEKGSIAVDGVSLTLASVGPAWFEVALIPTTLQWTTLGSLREGDRVNLETDCIARIVVSWLRRRGSDR